MEAYYYLVALALVIVIPHAFASNINGSDKKNPATYVDSQSRQTAPYGSGQIPNEDSHPPRVLSYWQRNVGINVPSSLNYMVYAFTYDFDVLRLTYHHTPNNHAGDGVDANGVQNYLDNMRFDLDFEKKIDRQHPADKVKPLNVSADKHHVYMNENNVEIVLKTDGVFGWDHVLHLISPNATMNVFPFFDMDSPWDPAKAYDASNKELVQANEIIFCGFEEKSKISVKYLWYTLECEMYNFGTVSRNGGRFGNYFWVHLCKFVS
eukprot:676740_1